MKLYSAFIKKNQDNKIKDVVLLDEGFSFLAFLFGGFWFLFHRMWSVAMIVFAINVLMQIMFAQKILTDLDIYILNVSFSIIVACNSKNWLEKHLSSCGYILSCFILSDNKQGAKIRAAQALHERYPDFSIDELSDIIIDPKGHCKKLNKQKNEPYFLL